MEHLKVMHEEFVEECKNDTSFRQEKHLTLETKRMILATEVKILAQWYRAPYKKDAYCPRWVKQQNSEADKAFIHWQTQYYKSGNAHYGTKQEFLNRMHHYRELLT